MIIVSAIISTFLYKVYYGVMETYADVEVVTEQEYRKRSFLATMYKTARQRSILLLKMYFEEDPFKLDDLNQELGEQARIFIKANTSLLEQQLNSKETELLEIQNQLIAINSPLQNQVAELLIDGDRDNAQELLFDHAIPGQHAVLAHIEHVISIYEGNGRAVISSIKANMEHSSKNILLLGATLLGTGILVMFVVTTRISRQEEQTLQAMLTTQKETSLALAKSQEKLTDYINALSTTFTALLTPEGKVELLNKAAAETTGLPLSSFIGRSFKNCHWWNYDRGLQDQLSNDISRCASGALINREVSVQVSGGRVITIHFLLTPIRDSTGKISSLVAEGQDVTEQKDAEEKLSYHASHDTLTGLINRREFEHRLDQLLHRSDDHNSHAVLYLDLDQFKVVNDTCGHHAGDELLRQVTKLIEVHIRKSDQFARLGGDEFGIILTACELEQADQLAQSVLNSISSYQFLWETRIFKVGVSIGVVEISGTETNLHDVMKRADSACYAAKEGGRNQVRVFQESNKVLRDRAEQMDWVSRINKSIQNDSFVLYAQQISPILPDSRVKVSYELLIRMIEDGALIPPNAFLPAAERYDLMIDIDRWVVSKAISWLEKNPGFVETIDHFSINLSAQSLVSEDFMNFLVVEIQRSNLAERICLEITETAAISNLAQAAQYISKLHDIGVRFSLDDFGSGLSSFGYLKTLKIDYLKIDGFFVKDIVSDPIDRAMVKSIHEVGSVMGKKTIAEYVENDEILSILREIGIDYAQGYGISKPIPLEQVLN